METRIPAEAASALEQDRRRRLRRRSRFRIAAADWLFPVIEITRKGFTIEAEEPPHLRGYVDILEGDEQIARWLVVCVSARDGLVGYEYKREGLGGDVPADFVLPGIAGLIEAPSD